MPVTIPAVEEPLITLRTEIGDDVLAPNGIKPDGGNFTDEFLLAKHSQEGTIGRTLAALCETLARQYAPHPTRNKMGPYSSANEAYQHYKSESNKLRRLHGYTPTDTQLGTPRGATRTEYYPVGALT